jgi:hypothetical protein
MAGERLYPGELANVDASNRRRELNGGSELLLEVVVQDEDVQWEGCRQMFTCGRRKKVDTCEMANTLRPLPPGERMGWHGAGAVRFWFPNDFFPDQLPSEFKCQILNSNLVIRS